MPKKIGDKYYLEAGDEVESDATTLVSDGKGGYTYKDLVECASLKYWVEEDEEWHEVHYDFGVPKNNTNYGRPCFTK